MEKISVGELSRFWQSGDINFRFTGRSSAIEGIRGHQYVQKKRGQDYISEKTVSLDVKCSEFTLKIQGRVDGYNPHLESPLIEEIKTLRISPDEIPESIRDVHLAQLKIYGYIICMTEELNSTTLRLCYLDLDDNSEHWLEEVYALEPLTQFFNETIERYTKAYRRRSDWIGIRDPSIGSAGFPYPEYRKGQRDMAVAVYRTIVRQEQLVIQAPTGIGKTMATIFPAVKATPDTAKIENGAANVDQIPGGKLDDHAENLFKGYDKVFFLSAKTSGQQMAEKTVREINDSGIRFRSITLTAKEKICFNPGTPCDPDYCEYARGYYDRLEEGLTDAVNQADQFTRQLVEQISRKHQLCPFEFSLDISRSVDLLICDYNYIFDPAVYLRRFFDDSQGNYLMLVDEAHNLVDRGRDMFSAQLYKENFLSTRRHLKHEFPVIARSLARVNAEILSLRKSYLTVISKNASVVVPDVPETLARSLRQFCEAAEESLREDSSPGSKDELLTLYFDCLRFLRIAEQLDKHYAFLLITAQKKTELKLFCINPASRLKEGFDRMASSVCFSATMKPQHYFQRLLGLSEDTNWYQIEPPFDPKKFGVFVAPYIQTSYKSRKHSIPELVELIRDVVTAKQGNYLIFFPSHAYLKLAYDAFVAGSPNQETLAQERFMSETDRARFLDAFTCDSELVGFAVMGGVFS